MARVRKGDQVMILSGKEKGKKGKVLTVFPQEQRLSVEGLNLVKRHLKKSQANPQGGTYSREGRLPLDRVMPVCPRCNQGVRVGFKALGDGTKSRYCRRCEENF